MAASGTMTGTGTLIGAVDNPLVTSSSFDISMEMASEADDFSVDLDIGIACRRRRRLRDTLRLRCNPPAAHPAGSHFGQAD